MDYNQYITLLLGDIDSDAEVECKNDMHMSKENDKFLICLGLVKQIKTKVADSQKYFALRSEFGDGFYPKLELISDFPHDVQTEISLTSKAISEGVLKEYVSLVLTGGVGYWIL